MKELESQNTQPLENFKKNFRRAFIASYPVFVAGTYCLSERYGMLGSHMIPWQIGTAIFLISGRVMDMRSTLRVSQTAQRLGKTVDEINPFIPTNPKKIAVDAALVVPSITFPPIGVAYGFLSFLAGAFNERYNYGLKLSSENEIGSTKNDGPPRD